MIIYYIDLENLKKKPTYAALLKAGEHLNYSLFTVEKDIRQLAVAQLYASGNKLTSEQLESLQKRSDDSSRREGVVERTQIYGLSRDEERAVDRALKDHPARIPPPPLDLDELAESGCLGRGVYIYQGTVLYVNEDQREITDSHLRKIANFKHGSTYIWYNSKVFLERDDAVIRSITEHLPTITLRPEEGAGETAKQPIPLAQPEPMEPSVEERFSAKNWAKIGLSEALDQHVERAPLRHYTPEEKGEVEGFYRTALDQLEQTADPLAERQHFRTSQIRQQRHSIEDTIRKILQFWDLMADSLNQPGKSNYLVTHAFKTSILAMQVATSMGFPKKEIINLGLASTLQDVGMRTCEHLIDKDTPLSPGEWVDLHQHPIRSIRFLEKSEGLSSLVLQLVLEAHERFDGSGYPHGLAGTKIHPLSRILAAVNMYVAMISPRPFRPALPPYTAIVTIVTNTYHSLLDREVTKVLLDVLSVCPVGMLVKLETGEIARVTSAHNALYTRPVVTLLYDADGNPYATPSLLDLASCDITITEIVNDADVPDVDALSKMDEFSATDSGKGYS